MENLNIWHLNKSNWHIRRKILIEPMCDSSGLPSNYKPTFYFDVTFSVRPAERFIERYIQKFPEVLQVRP